MKLYYVETNGYMMVAATNGDETRCFVHDDPECICYLDTDEKSNAAKAYLEQIDTDCFEDWDAEDSDGNPYTIEHLTSGCDILAELEA